MCVGCICIVKSVSMTPWDENRLSAPQASVGTYNTRSEYFNLYCSTRQGCPLRPLLFAIAIEPLSVALKSDPL